MSWIMDVEVDLTVLIDVTAGRLACQEAEGRALIAVVTRLHGGNDRSEDSRKHRDKLRTPPELGFFHWTVLIGRMVALVRKGGDTTTRTEIETAGSGKDLGFWLWPLGAGRCKAAPYAIEGPHPSPAASSATVEERVIKNKRQVENFSFDS
eukprot:scaffold12125_cov63-Phaeocystis_antarctica.AAC.2